MIPLNPQFLQATGNVMMPSRGFSVPGGMPGNPQPMQGLPNVSQMAASIGGMQQPQGMNPMMMQALAARMGGMPQGAGFQPPMNPQGPMPQQGPPSFQQQFAGRGGMGGGPGLGQLGQALMQRGWNPNARMR